MSSLRSGSESLDEALALRNPDLAIAVQSDGILSTAPRPGLLDHGGGTIEVQNDSILSRASGQGVLDHGSGTIGVQNDSILSTAPGRGLFDHGGGTIGAQHDSILSRASGYSLLDHGSGTVGPRNVSILSMVSGHGRLNHRGETLGAGHDLLDHGGQVLGVQDDNIVSLASGHGLFGHGGEMQSDSILSTTSGQGLFVYGGETLGVQNDSMLSMSSGHVGREGPFDHGDGCSTLHMVPAFRGEPVICRDGDNGDDPKGSVQDGNDSTLCWVRKFGDRSMISDVNDVCDSSLLVPIQCARGHHELPLGNGDSNEAGASSTAGSNVSDPGLDASRVCLHDTIISCTRQIRVSERSEHINPHISSERNCSHQASLHQTTVCRKATEEDYKKTDAFWRNQLATPDHTPDVSTTSNKQFAGNAIEPDLWSNLPDHILDRILTFLPFWCIFRFQSVSSKWKTHLQARSFQESCRRPALHEVLFIMSLDFSHLKVAAAYNPMLNKWHLVPLSYFCPVLPLKKFNILAAVDSLLCLEEDEWPERPLFVANPINRTYRKLPPMLKMENTFVVGMVMDDDEKGYRILVAQDGQELVSQFYESKSNTWKMNETFNRRASVIAGAVYEGLFICLTIWPIGLIAYNIKKASWCDLKVRLPASIVSPHVLEFKKQLLLVGGVEEFGQLRSIRFWKIDLTNQVCTETERMPDHLFHKLTFSGQEHFFSVGQAGLICFYDGLTANILMYSMVEKRWWWLPPCPLFHYQNLGFSIQPRFDLRADVII